MKTLQNQQLFAKAVKCKFGYHEIEYLGHVISTKEVKANPTKIEGMIKWPLLVSEIFKGLPWSHELL